MPKPLSEILISLRNFAYDSGTLDPEAMDDDDEVEVTELIDILADNDCNTCEDLQGVFDKYNAEWPTDETMR